jgi:hypothetical protein
VGSEDVTGWAVPVSAAELAMFRKWFCSVPRMVLPDRVRSRKGGHLMLNGLLSGALALLIVGAVYLLQGLVPWLPSAYKLGSIAKYLTLAGGVLCGAWVEVNFFSEHIRHYASMTSLFEAAGVRFDEYFNRRSRNYKRTGIGVWAYRCIGEHGDL